jgi:hypothetical protein
MKILLTIPIIVTVALAAAAGMCWMVGVPPHGKDLVLAAAVAVVAAELGLLPAALMRRGEPALRAQLALGGTVVQMIVTILMAVAVMTAKVVEPRQPFVFWLTGAYWVALAGLCWSLVKATRTESVNVK